jgi:hypothetical protein
MNEQPTTPESEEPGTAGPDPTTASTDHPHADDWAAPDGAPAGRTGRTDVAAIFASVLDAVVGIARDVADTAGPAIHDALVKAGPGVREGAARAADVAAKAADAAGPAAGKVAGVTSDAGHRLAERSRGLASDLRSMGGPTSAGPADDDADPAGDATPPA